MVRDPVCLMNIELREAAAMTIDEGRGYYFCSNNCRDKFIAEPERYRRNFQAERLCVGVMGSAGDDETDPVKQRVHLLGETIAEHGLILITGACPGLPYECAMGARTHGGLSVGISPALSLDEHIYKYHSPADAFDVLIYTGSGMMGREVINIRSSDMVVIVGGRSGTLGEFAIAYEEGKLIGVLEGSGGITGDIPAVIEHIGKKTGAQMIYEGDPAALLEQMLESYAGQHFNKPSCFCDESQAAGG